MVYDVIHADRFVTDSSLTAGDYLQFQLIFRFFCRVDN